MALCFAQGGKGGHGKKASEADKQAAENSEKLPLLAAEDDPEVAAFGDLIELEAAGEVSSSQSHSRRNSQDDDECKAGIELVALHHAASTDGTASTKKPATVDLLSV